MVDLKSDIEQHLLTLRSTNLEQNNQHQGMVDLKSDIEQLLMSSHPQVNKLGTKQPTPGNG